MLVVIAKEINESKTEVKLHTAPCTRSCIGIVVFYFGRLYLPFSLKAGILGQHAKYLQVVRVSEEKKSVQNTFLHQFLDRGLLNFYVNILLSFLTYPLNSKLLTSIVSKSSVTKCPWGAVIFHVQYSSGS